MHGKIGWRVEPNHGCGTKCVRAEGADLADSPSPLRIFETRLFRSPPAAQVKPSIIDPARWDIESQRHLAQREMVGSLAIRVRGKLLITQVKTPHPVLLPIALACKRDIFELPAAKAWWLGEGTPNRCNRSKHHRAFRRERASRVRAFVSGGERRRDLWRLVLLLERECFLSSAARPQAFQLIVAYERIDHRRIGPPKHGKNAALKLSFSVIGVAAHFPIEAVVP